LPVVRSLSTP